MVHGYSRVALALLQQVANNVSTALLLMGTVLMWLLLLLFFNVVAGAVAGFAAAQIMQPCALGMHTCIYAGGKA